MTVSVEHADILRDIRDNLDLTLSDCLHLLKSRVNVSVFQLGITAEVDPSAFNKIYSGTERRFLNHDQIDNLVHGLVSDRLLPPYDFHDKSNETRLWLMALQSIASAEAQISIITQRNSRATLDDLRKARRRIVEALRDVWDETESAVPAMRPRAYNVSLKWDALPSDLDLFLCIETEYDSNIISFRNTGTTNTFPFATLDNDCRVGHGPETITLTRFLEGRYFCFVHNFSEEKKLREANARLDLRVAFYERTFGCPRDGNGNCWLVFCFDTRSGNIEEFNKLIDWSTLDRMPFESIYGSLRKFP